jgi:hypothetical protein
MQNTPNRHKSEDFNQGHKSVAPLTIINRPRTSGSTGSEGHLGENAKFVTLGESGAMLGSLASILTGPSLKENISIFQVKQKKRAAHIRLISQRTEGQNRGKSQMP